MKPRRQPGKQPGNWREAAWRGRRHFDASIGHRKLDSLSAEDRAEIDSELALDQLLGVLPSVTASNHLASRIRAEIRKESRGKSRWGYNRMNWLPAWFSQHSRIRWIPVGLAVAMAAIPVVSHWSGWQRGVMARNVAEVTKVTSVPGIEVLRNFNAIAALGTEVRTTSSDVDLMAALEK